LKEGKINLPNNFIVPEKYETSDFHFTVLEPSLTKIDYEAVMSSQERLRQVFRLNDSWPAKEMTIDENTKDLIRHESEFRMKKAFAYSVYREKKNNYIGCVYINPTSKKNYSCEVYLWVKDSRIELDEKLLQQTKEWLEKYWNLKSVAYPGRDIPWSIW
jgi:hypothetical protein|tara:strand:+ start:28699 stop:29175 length:477 start_codon:yes stop_codon:yes gene_type:complete